jgi:hypothetical protein
MEEERRMEHTEGEPEDVIRDAVAHARLRDVLDTGETVYGHAGSAIVRVQAQAPDDIEITTFGLFGTIRQHHETVDAAIESLRATDLLPETWERAGEPKPPVVLLEPTAIQP